MKALLLLMLLATLAVGQTSPSNLRSIEGTVVEFGTGKPIAGAQVGLVNSQSTAAARGGQAAPFLSVSTDASGQFRFSNVASGFYDIQIEREGYFRPGAFNVGPNASVATDSIDATIDVKGLAYWLVQGGTVSGRVLDVDGRPMASIPITVLRVGYDPGGNRILNVVDPGQSRAAGVRASSDGIVRGAANGMLRIVTLIPEPPRRRSFALYGWASVISEGSFTFPSVAPGRYKLFAWISPWGAALLQRAVSVAVRIARQTRHRHRKR
jgi:hypothetical protein